MKQNFDSTSQLYLSHTKRCNEAGKCHAHRELEVAAEQRRPVVRPDAARRAADKQQVEREHLQHETHRRRPSRS